MDTLRDLDIVRALPAAASVRSDAGAGDLGRLTVRFSPFNQWYEVHSWWEGDFMERTVKGAFAKTMKESKRNVVTLFDHGYDPQIGNKVLAPTDDLREDDDSAVLEGDLFDTAYNRELAPGLRAGVYGSSFKFRVIQDQWNDEPGTSEHNPMGLPERTITEVRLFEAGPVTFPASPTATAGLRSTSMTDAYYEQVRSREPHRYEDLVARAQTIRTPIRAAATGTVIDLGAASHDRNEPARGHSGGHTARRRREVLFPFLKEQQ